MTQKWVGMYISKWLKLTDMSVKGTDRSVKGTDRSVKGTDRSVKGIDVFRHLYMLSGPDGRGF